MDRDAHVELFRSETRAFAGDLGHADLDAPVPTCPEWTVRDLTRHLGTLHRWATSIVERATVVETWRPAEPVQLPDRADDAAAWATWFVTGAEDAAGAFQASDPSARVWAWGADQHARFWPRRMLVEAAVHRLDLAAALGLHRELEARLAVEAVDEFLENLPYAARWRSALHGLQGDDRTLTFRASDTGDGWQVRLSPNGWWWDRSTTQGDVTLEGPAAQLLLELHGRPAAILTQGDDEVLATWRRATIF